MFNKKCPNCNEKVNSKYNFCPNCRFSLKKKENLGMLGRSDYDQDSFSDPLLGGMGGNMLGKMIGSAMKMLEKEMQKEIAKPTQQPKTNIKLMINGKEIKINNQNPQVQKTPIKKQIKQIPKIKLPNNKLNSSRFPKKEPKTHVRRLSDKVIYEVELPGVKSEKNISIIRLENGFEIKALAKDKIYIKNISLNLPIISYELEKETLTLELEAKN